jgi:hypothetical protein
MAHAVCRAFTVAVFAKAETRKAQTQARHARLRKKVLGNYHHINCLFQV